MMGRSWAQLGKWAHQAESRRKTFQIGETESQSYGDTLRKQKDIGLAEAQSEGRERQRAVAECGSEYVDGADREGLVWASRSTDHGFGK